MFSSHGNTALKFELTIDPQHYASGHPGILARFDLSLFALVHPLCPIPGPTYHLLTNQQPLPIFYPLPTIF